MLHIVVVVALSVGASLHAQTKFAAWLGDNVVVEERVVDVADGVRVAYALKPAPIGTTGERAAMFEDAFFLVDARGNVIDVAARTSGGDDACAAPGDVATIERAPDDKHALIYAAAHPESDVWATTSVCRVVIDRGHVRLNPDPTKHIDENAPLASRAVKKLANGEALTWRTWPGTELLVAQADKSGDVWFVDRTGHVDVAHSEQISQALACSVAPDPYDAGGADNASLSLTVSASDSACTCSVDVAFHATCVEEGRGPSPGVLAMREAELSESEKDERARDMGLASVGERLGPVEDAARFVVDVARANRDAKAQWDSHKHDDARALWLTTFRRYIASGRALPAALPSPFADLVTLAGNVDETTFAANEIAETLNNLGFALADAGEYRQALAAYDECRAFVARANISRPVLQKNIDDAERALQHAK